VPEVLWVNPDEPDEGVVARALAVLAAGELLIYPTDTLYALGGRAVEAASARAVRAAKGRDDAKPLPVIAADGPQARTLAAVWTEAAERLAAAFWPGPLTLVLPASAIVPPEVTSGTSTVAIRVPALVLARDLAGAAGPLISTSANRSGLPPPLTCAEAVRQVGASASLALDGGRGGEAPSTIVDLTGAAPRLLRAGAVDWDRARQVLG
jgi:L-threonylcarbamoyladenylate synthase